MKKLYKPFILLLAISVLVSACGSSPKSETKSAASPNGKVLEYTLETNMIDGQMAFIGIGGGIDGVKNPTLSANVGDTVKVTLVSGDGIEHGLLLAARRPVTRRRVRVGALRIGGFMPFDIQAQPVRFD